ncbi:MAG: glucan biosynthesis protein G [Gammaproteobacteria bacterium]|nr:glucan biosynthesis protein G [Gammaproteobacteria bacterium]
MRKSSFGVWIVFALGISGVAIASPGKVAPPPAPEQAVAAAEAPLVPEVRPFDFSDVETKAQELSKQSYLRDDSGMPESLVKLNYDQYRDIRYKTEKSIWRDEGLPFQVQAFHRGFMFKDRVIVNIIDHGSSTRVGYSPDLFDYGKNRFETPLPEDLGFAGLRFHYPLKRDETFDEIAVFLGASYFRAVGLGQAYGLSARGLAIDTGLPKAEEFPIFREFWVEKPDKEANALTVYALLDSPSVSAAYRFVLRPGLDLAMDVQSHLYFRKKVERLGIAPLTSMFMQGENTDRFMDDFRPEVHDSDGLLIGKSTGEWMWRPLNNPKQLRISVFKDAKPSGFGLMSRDRNFDHYQDLEAGYHLRPSAWVEPMGDWGAGGIYLIEIPSDAEKYDNIVAFWVPDEPTGEGKELRYDYRLHFVTNEFTAPSGGKVVSTRVGSAGAKTNRRKFVVDFTSPMLKLMSPKAKVEAEVSAVGKITDVVVQKNEAQGTWRLSFDLEPEKGRNPTELRAILKSGKDILTESWVYQWNTP